MKAYSKGKDLNIARFYQTQCSQGCSINNFIIHSLNDSVILLFRILKTLSIQTIIA